MDEAIAAADERMAVAVAQIEAQAGELADRRQRLNDLERVATRLSERVVEREGELRRLRAELAYVTRRTDVEMATLTALVGELEDVRRTARGQATRIRLAALREAAELSERIGEITKRPEAVRERMLDALMNAIGRVGGEAAEPAGASERPRRAQEAASEKAQTSPQAASTNGHRESDVGDLFDGMIEVEVGPLQDFAQLVLFEDAAKSIDATTDISVRRFSAGRATLEMSLREPVALLRELEERCDLELVVRDVRKDRVVLDVGA